MRLRTFFQYLRAPQTSWVKKASLVFAALYVLSPIDAIPDWIPLLGWLDDVGVVTLLFRYWMKDFEDYVRAQKASVSGVEDGPWLKREPPRENQ